MLQTLQTISGALLGMFELSTNMIGSMLKAYQYFAESLTFTTYFIGFLPTVIGSCVFIIAIVSISKMVIFKV